MKLRNNTDTESNTKNTEIKKRKKVIKIAGLEKSAKDNTLHNCPYRDPNNITLDSEEESEIDYQDITMDDGAWSNEIDQRLLNTGFSQNNTPQSMNSFNSPYMYTSENIRNIIEPRPVVPPANPTPAVSQSVENSANVVTTSTVSTATSTSPSQPMTYSTVQQSVYSTAQQSVNSTVQQFVNSTAQHFVNSTAQQQQHRYSFPPSSNPRRLSGFPQLEESSTDKLIKALMEKLETGFNTLNTNMTAMNNYRIPVQQPNQPTAENVRNVPPTVPQPVAPPVTSSGNVNLSAPQPIIPGTNPTQNVSSRSLDSGETHISRLENMLSDLANQVQTLNERINLNSAPTQSNSQNFSPNYFGNPYPYNIKTRFPEKWKLRYDGNNNKLAIEFFLNQVTLNKDINDLTWAQVLNGFQHLLEGPALKWFLRYQNKCLNTETAITWPTLKSDMMSQFRGTDTEESLWCAMTNRKQGDRETFDKFYDALLDIQDRISRQFSDFEMIGIIRNNLKYETKKCLVSFATTSLTQFVNQCRLTDRLIYPHLYPGHVPYTRRVAELEPEIEKPSQEIEAFTPRRQQNTDSFAKVKCWNCDAVGHDWRRCEAKRNIFCYYCGHKNVICLECPTCYQNFRSGPNPTDHPPSAPSLNH